MFILIPTNALSGDLMVYPFLDKNATSAQLASNGYIEAFTNPNRLHLFGVIKWNLWLKTTTPEEWEKLDATMKYILEEITKTRRTIVPDQSERWSVEGWDQESISIRLSSGKRFRVVAYLAADAKHIEQLNADEKHWMNGDKTRDPFRTRYIETLPSFMLDEVRK